MQRDAQVDPKKKAAHRRALDRLASGGDVRAQKIRRLRAAIRAGRYENLLKLSIAADRVLDEMR